LCKTRHRLARRREEPNPHRRLIFLGRDVIDHRDVVDHTCVSIRIWVNLSQDTHPWSWKLFGDPGVESLIGTLF